MFELSDTRRGFLAWEDMLRFRLKFSNKYKVEDGLDKKVSYLREWYKSKDGAGKKKVDSAMRIFESDKKIEYPQFLKDAFNFD